MGYIPVRRHRNGKVNLVSIVCEKRASRLIQDYIDYIRFVSIKDLAFGIRASIAGKERASHIPYILIRSRSNFPLYTMDRHISSATKIKILIRESKICE